MRLPWQEDEEKQQMEQKINELKEEIEELEEEKESLDSKFEAEKERRSELATKKQEAEKRLNVVEQRLQTLEEQEEPEEEEEEKQEFKELSFKEGYNLIKKLESISSPERELITVYSPAKVSSVDDFKGLKNSITKEQLEHLQSQESFISFLDNDLFHHILKTRPFFDSKWKLDHEFYFEPLMEFIETEKIWVLVSAGETEIYRERAGDIEEIDTIKSRVDRQHSQGGFSQGRFERKRDEQIDEHLNQVKAALKDKKPAYLLGEKKLCKRLNGKYLGGFDDNRSLKDELYKFRISES